MLKLCNKEVYKKMIKETQHTLREKIIFFIYEKQLMNYELGTIFDKIQENSDDFNLEVQKQLQSFFEKRAALITLINNYLKPGWHFLKLAALEQAILLWSTCEILVFKKSRAIIIDEAVIIAKKYLFEDTYKYINATLDNIANSNTTEGW